MKVFASNFLEPIVSEQIVPLMEWTWEPINQDIKEIYASGNKTATKQSTYATERDNESDVDRPNEGR